MSVYVFFSPAQAFWGGRGGGVYWTPAPAVVSRLQGRRPCKVSLPKLFESHFPVVSPSVNPRNMNAGIWQPVLRERKINSMKFFSNKVVDFSIWPCEALCHNSAIQAVPFIFHCMF